MNDFGDQRSDDSDGVLGLGPADVPTAGDAGAAVGASDAQADREASGAGSGDLAAGGGGAQDSDGVPVGEDDVEADITQSGSDA